jgi:membrane fusion protein (multidrug efflux system)
MMQVDLRPQVEGYITGIFFKEGSHVKKGQQLYEIDRSKYQATYGQAQAAQKVAESNLEQAQKDADRYNFLNQHDAVAKQTLDHAMTTLQNAKNQVASAKQDVVKSQTDLNYSIIRAPFDGTIGLSQVKLGTSVSTGQTILNTISTEDPMAVDFVINEKQIPRFIKMQQQKPSLADSILTLIMPDNTVYSQPGQIYVIDRGVNPQTGSITVRLSFPNAEGLLRSGMSTQVRVRNQDTGMQLMIPNKAIVEQMGEYFVYVAKDTLIKPQGASQDTIAAKPSLHAIQKKVTTGATVGNRIIVTSGLEDGDRVIVDGVQKLHDGSAIAEHAPPPPGQKPAH